MSSQNLLRTTLLASVGLNLFLLGVLVPGWLGHRGPPPAMHVMPGPGPGGMPGPGGLPFLRQALEELPPADADILRAMLEEAPDLFRKLGEDTRARLEKARELIRAEPFDPQALQRELQAVSDLRIGFDKQRIEDLTRTLSAMSPEGRRKLAESRLTQRIVEGPDGEPPRGERGPGEAGQRPGGIPFDRDRMPNPPPPPPSKQDDDKAPQ